MLSDVTVILPAHNEAVSIGKLIADIRELNPQFTFAWVIIIARTGLLILPNVEDAALSRLRGRGRDTWCRNC